MPRFGLSATSSEPVVGSPSRADVPIALAIQQADWAGVARGYAARRTSPDEQGAVSSAWLRSQYPSTMARCPTGSSRWTTKGTSLLSGHAADAGSPGLTVNVTMIEVSVNRRSGGFTVPVSPPLQCARETRAVNVVAESSTRSPSDSRHDADDLPAPEPEHPLTTRAKATMAIAIRARLMTPGCQRGSAAGPGMRIRCRTKPSHSARLCADSVPLRGAQMCLMDGSGGR